MDFHFLEVFLGLEDIRDDEEVTDWFHFSSNHFAGFVSLLHNLSLDY